jgi:hypothetical protein
MLLPNILIGSHWQSEAQSPSLIGTEDYPMAPRYLSYNPRAAETLHQPARPAYPWWRPLTNPWGILGLIIFIGLVLRLIDAMRMG